MNVDERTRGQFTNSELLHWFPPSDLDNVGDSFGSRATRIDHVAARVPLKEQLDVTV
jgi:hypothetical protein